ncbi:MAG: DUF4240 domain-containing protein [Deltaproteobacteria bacterium]|nr:DUF4240 domain-containing protein [Deltaproteobacteria bacterium]
MSIMTETRFWEIIDSSREAARLQERQPNQDFLALHEQSLADALRQLPPEEIAAFDDRFRAYHRFAYRWDLWAAAYWLHGGCSDDGFTDFRACLISLGRVLYFKVLQEPDSLADIVDHPDVPYMQAEGFQYVASRVYEEKTGERIPYEPSDSHVVREPAGERLDHDDEELMRERFPKLVARFPEMGD